MYIETTNYKLLSIKKKNLSKDMEGDQAESIQILKIATFAWYVDSLCLKSFAIDSPPYTDIVP